MKVRGREASKVGNLRPEGAKVPQPFSRDFWVFPHEEQRALRSLFRDDG